MSDNNNYFAPLSPQSMEFMNLLEKQLAQQSQQDSSPSNTNNSTSNMFNNLANGITPSPNRSNSNYGGFNSSGGRSQSQSQSPLSDYTSNPFGSAAFSGSNPSRSNSNGGGNGFNGGVGGGMNNQPQTPSGAELAALLPLLQANGFAGMLAGMNGGNQSQNAAGLGRNLGQTGGNVYSNGNGSGAGNGYGNQASNGFNASMTGNNNGQMVLTPQMLNALVAGLAAQQGININSNGVGNGNGAVNPLLAMGFGATGGNPGGNGSGFMSGGVNAFAPAAATNTTTVNPTGPAWNPYPQPGVHTPEGSSGKESSPSNGSSPEADMSGQAGHQGGPSRQTSTSSNLQGSNNSQRQASTGSTSSNHNNGTSSRMTSPPLNPIIDELKHGHAPAKQATASGSNAAAGSSASSRRGSQSGRARGAKNDAGAGGADAHKRKAEGDELGGHDAHRRHLDGNSDDETSDDDHMTGTGRKPKKTSGRRKSSGAGAEDQTPESKALKRKNQNRAAQKAFRERREARVKDLEDKVAELESKNAGQAFENENLRQMLSKLQKENMQFKRTDGDFTFTMPLPDREAAANQSIQSDKLPSPPLSLVVSRGEEAAESSRARRDNSTPGASSHNGASSYDSPSSGMGDQSSPDALNSASTSTNGPALFNPEPYNAFIPNNNGFADVAGGSAAYSPFAAAAENLQALSSTDIQQLLAAFRDQQQAMGQITGATPQFSGYREGNTPAAMNTDAGINDADINDIFGDEDAMNAFLRSLSQPEDSAADVDVLDTLPAPPTEPSIAPWTPANPNAPAGMSYGSDLFGSYMLRGFKGTPNGFPDTNAKAGKKDSGSGSNASASMDTSFSPSNYLTTSPDPMGNASTSSEIVKHEREGCPFGDALKTGVMPTDGDMTFNVKGEDGQMMTSQELWTNLQSKVDLSSGFDLDDLCDNFKAKAKCDGTGPVISKVEVDKILSEYSAKRSASSTLI